MKRNLIIILLLILFSHCQKEREDIFGKSKETKEKERTCDPVATFFVCEVINIQLCVNSGLTENECSSRKGACYIQRANLCNGSTYL
ncbi:hypothetical protein AB3N60_10905 [Leptospira sp. WS39.C2]